MNPEYKDFFLEVPFLLVLFCMGTTVFASIGCSLVRYFAIKKSILMDLPNNRSSHKQPMARGGGAPMVVAAIVAIALLSILRPTLIFPKWAAAICLGGAAIGWIGWRDDRYSLTPSKKFAIHVIASIWAVHWLIPSNVSFFYKFLAALWVAWSINFFNFMDGIDGLAGAEAIIIGIGAGYISGRVGTQPTLAINWLIASATLGFLFWNWPPAKIFMGDTGSGFLGYCFGCLAIGSGLDFKGGFPTYFILLFLFFIDTTYTLIKRIIKGERFWEAHCQHLYQKAAQKGFSHLEITLFFVICNMLLFIIAAVFAGIGYH
jgi:Fuc2NAc and GlcNAc transferase